ncbi:haloacid dehalogenase-like hydrolase [candidate division KSB1 bacterium]|nr:haloacid dehalogenase-like hydrolase [candidate division KSB1 bacterium]
MKILLFDIDGTLMLSGGAGLRAMNEAFLRVYGKKDVLLNIKLAGRTDTSIIEDALAESNIPFESEKFEYYKSVYYDLLEKEITQPSSEKKLMPGIKELLPLLTERKGVYLGLLTGNWEKSGRIKIGHFGLNGYFTFGAFANDSGIRNDLLPFAIKRFIEKYNVIPKPDDVYVIGDTPADINCAKPHGALAVAIGASFYTVDQLKEYNPDYLLTDLSDTGQVLQILG